MEEILGLEPSPKTVKPVYTILSLAIAFISLGLIYLLAICLAVVGQ